MSLSYPFPFWVVAEQSQRGREFTVLLAILNLAELNLYPRPWPRYGLILCWKGTLNFPTNHRGIARSFRQVLLLRWCRFAWKQKGKVGHYYWTLIFQWPIWANNLENNYRLSMTCGPYVSLKASIFFSTLLRPCTSLKRGQVLERPWISSVKVLEITTIVTATRQDRKPHWRFRLVGWLEFNGAFNTM